MSYPTQVLQYAPAANFEAFLHWVQPRNLFRELARATQDVIRIAGGTVPFTELFFRIMVYRIWSSQSTWALIEGVQPIGRPLF
jgi:hypothetical protein